MFWTIFLAGFVGWLIFMLGNLQSVNKLTPELTFKQTVSYYWNKSAFYIIGSFLTLWAMVYIININGIQLIANYFFSDDLAKSLPFETKEVKVTLAFITGLSIEAVSNLLRRIFKPVG